MMRRSALAMAALAAAQAVGQVVVPPAADPGAVQQRQMEEERRRREAEQGRPRDLEPIERKALEEPAAKPSDSAVKFLVREIEFSPSEILTPAELEDAARDFKGREATLAELQQLAERINALYRAKGVVTALAVIPPQDVSQGLVRVRLVEGRIGRVNIQGNSSFRTGFIEGRLGAKPGELVDLGRLERSMVRFNRTNDAQLRAALRPGGEFGTTDLHVDVAEPPRHDLRLMVDDLGSPATGRTRATVAYTNRSLFGFGDGLYLSDTEADGQSSRAVAYGFPVNPWGGRLDIAYNKDKTSIEHGALAPLDITGESKAWTFLLRQPTYVGRRVQLDVLAGGGKRESRNWIDSQFLMGTETKDKNVGFELHVFRDRDYWLASYTRHFIDATVVRSTKLVIDRGALRYSHDFGEGYVLSGDLSWQSTSDDALPSSELFFIGGDGSVQGYATGARSGDTGQCLNLELYHPLGAWSRGDRPFTLAGVLSFDHGVVKPFRPPDSSLPKHERLTGMAWGLNASWNKRIAARVVYSYGFTDVPDDQEDRGVHFQVMARLF